MVNRERSCRTNKNKLKNEDNNNNYHFEEIPTLFFFAAPKAPEKKIEHTAPKAPEKIFERVAPKAPEKIFEHVAPKAPEISFVCYYFLQRICYYFLQEGVGDTCQPQGRQPL